MFEYLCPKLSEEYQEEAKIFITALSWSFQETAEVLGHIVREITFMPVKALTKRETSINKNRLVSPEDKTGYINNQMNFTWKSIIDQLFLPTLERGSRGNVIAI